MVESSYAYPDVELNQGASENCTLGSQAPVMKIMAYEDVPSTEGALMKVG